MNGLVVGAVGLHVVYLLGTKWTLSSGTGYGFIFPLCLGCWHIGICLLSMTRQLMSVNALAELLGLWKRQWKSLLAVGGLLALDVAFQYASLINQSLTLNQIIRAIIPAFMGIGVIVIERRWPPPAEFATLCLLGVGVGLALWDGTIVGSPYASLCCMTGAACHTAVIYFAGKVFGCCMPSTRAASNLLMGALTCLLPLYLWLEAARVERFWSIAGGSAMAVILSSSLLAALYAHVECRMMKEPQDFHHLAEAKLISVLLGAFFFLGEKSVYTPLLTLGCLLTIAGVYGFKVVRQQRQGPEPGCTMSERRYQQEHASELAVCSAINSVIRV